ncbi:MAG TPA: LptE family protein [Ignavibacteriaceae bacterium]
MIYNLIKINRIRTLKIMLIVLLLCTLVVINFGCSSYSFTGSSVPTHLRTISIPVAQDKSPAGIPGLRESLTDALIQKFINDNSLQVSGMASADATLNCVITSVTDAPAIVSAGEQITARKVTIIVRVLYKDLVMKKTVFEKDFTGYGEYVPGQATNLREDAIAIAVNYISEDILLAVVSGW